MGRSREYHGGAFRFSIQSEGGAQQPIKATSWAGPAGVKQGEGAAKSSGLVGVSNRDRHRANQTPRASGVRALYDYKARAAHPAPRRLLPALTITQRTLTLAHFAPGHTRNNKSVLPRPALFASHRRHHRHQTPVARIPARQRRCSLPSAFGTTRLSSTHRRDSTQLS